MPIHPPNVQKGSWGPRGDKERARVHRASKWQGGSSTTFAFNQARWPLVPRVKHRDQKLNGA